MNFAGALTYPFSLLYGFAGWYRNHLFDIRVLRQRSFDIPVICVGNLSAGGTGKSPHIEYLVRLLQPHCTGLSTLSRGYGRRTRGFILADENTTAADIGDEPAQFSQKFMNLQVAVDECRVRGIQKLQETNSSTDCVLLDDAFQHRYVKPGLNILLTDYFHPYFRDHVLPSGRLREFRSGAKRADIIIVTKCPPVLSPITRKSFLEKIKPRPHQKVYFSTVKYGQLIPLDPQCTLEPVNDKKYYAILAFAGIANTYPLEEQLKRICIELEMYKFPDHHVYSPNEMLKLREKFCNIVGKNKIIVTTEKDAVRLQDPQLKAALNGLPVYYQPIEVEFFKEDKIWFDKQILEYAGKNQSKR